MFTNAKSQKIMLNEYTERKNNYASTKRSLSNQQEDFNRKNSLPFSLGDFRMMEQGSDREFKTSNVSMNDES